MIDGIIKGTGNSRKLKSAITEATTWEQFRAALIAGTLPIDLAGINSAGWQQIGTALSKANLLNDTTAALINTLVGSTPSTPDAALSAITGKTQTLYNGRVQIATGSYTGTGTYGSSNPTSIAVGFVPKLGFIKSRLLIGSTQVTNLLMIPRLTNTSTGVGFTVRTDAAYLQNLSTAEIVVLAAATTQNWYSSNSQNAQMNLSGIIYDYVFLG